VAEPIPLLTDGTPGGGPTLVLAHGAGATMDSPFMEQIASALAARGLVIGGKSMGGRITSISGRSAYQSTWSARKPRSLPTA
jgi:predicted alpha/beta-hydrolase family hydrolase